MTREEAIYRLKALLTMCDFRDAFGDRVDDKLYEDAVAIAIEALKETQWIPCSEKLPSVEQWSKEHPIMTNKIGSLQGCMDFKQRDEARDDEDIKAKSIATAFQFGVALGFAKKYDEMDKVIEEVKKAITPERKTGRWVTPLYHNSNAQWYACSECAGAPLWDEYGQEVLSDYCPNCGAKMMEE